MPDIDSSNLPAGTGFGSFEIQSKIADGGMGTVYRARQAFLNRNVALKILSPRLTADASYVESFRRESQAAANLHHPNLISVYDAGEIEGLHYYAMELVEGETLLNWLKREGALPERTALEITMCVASALKYAWDKEHLIHRDVKPENIIIDVEGNVKLCDLGLAKTFGENTLLTLSGLTLGTPHYVSPEQARGDAVLDQRSDIYSLGMSLYHMLTGEVPFPAGSAAAVMAKHLTEQLADPRETAADISPRACRLLEKLLAKNREDRYQSWDEVLADIEKVYGGDVPQASALAAGKSTLRRNPQLDLRAAAKAAPRSSSVEKALSQRRAAQTRRKSMMAPMIFAAVALAMLGGMAAFFLLQRPQKQEPPPTNLPNTTAVLAQKALKDTLEFAAANPKNYDEIIGRLQAVIKQYPGTETEKEARKHLDDWLERKRAAWQAASPAALALKDAEEFIKANPNDIDGIIGKLRSVVAEHGSTAEAEQARVLLAAWQERKAEAERKLKEEEEKRLAEEQRKKEEERQLAEERRKKEEEERRAAEERALAQAGLFKAEVKWLELGRAFVTALGQRDYGAAAKVMRTTASDPALAALKNRATVLADGAELLQAFWAALPKELSKLKGQQFAIQNTRGTFIEVDKGDLVIEVREGVQVSIALASLSYDDWIRLVSLVPDPKDGKRALTLAWFSFGEGKLEKTAEFLEQAKKAGIDPTAIREHMNSLALTLPVSEEGFAALKELRALAEKQQWVAARPRLEALRARFGQVPVIQAASEELAQLEKKIAEFEKQNVEAAAQKLIGDLKVCVQFKDWKRAREIVDQLRSQYSQTKAVETAGKELDVLAQTALFALGLAPSGDEDKERRQLVQKRGGQIIIVRRDAPEADVRGPEGEKQFRTLPEALDAAKAGDGIEIWEGVYRTGRIERPLDDILIYGKAGAFPMIQSIDKPVKEAKDLVWLFTVGENWQLENLILVAEPTGEGMNHTFFRTYKAPKTTVRIKGCVIGGGGPLTLWDGSNVTMDLEDCLVVNIRRLCSYWNVGALKINRCTFVDTRTLFIFNPDHGKQQRDLNISMQSTVMYKGSVFVESKKLKERPLFSGGNKYGITYKGDNNLFVTRRGAIMVAPENGEVDLEEWRRCTGSDRSSAAQDVGNVDNVFADRVAGDFRIHPENIGIRMAPDRGAVGVRWPLWKWKLLVEKWPKLDL